MRACPTPSKNNDSSRRPSNASALQRNLRRISCVVLTLAIVLLCLAPTSAHAQTPAANPLRWRNNQTSITLSILGNVLNDDANSVRIAFPPASVLFPATVTYTATTLYSDVTLGESVSVRQGEILGLFQLAFDGSAPFAAADGAHDLASADLPPESIAPQQSALLQAWTLRLAYAACATPVGCEFAHYDEASMSCLWLNPATGDWQMTDGSVDVDANRLTCRSNSEGLHAIVARRAETSGEVESPPVYLPVVTGK